MSALKRACERASATKSFPRRGDRIEIERAEQRIGAAPSGKARVKEAWARFLARIDPTAPERLKPKDLKRLLDGIWEEGALEAAVPPLLDQSVAQSRKSVDRSIIAAYLRHFPLDHPGFDRLMHASALVANRHDWPWRARGYRWALWDPDEGPSRLSRSLLETDGPAQLLREAGLDGDLATGGFVEEALITACEVAADQRGEDAQRSGRRLIALFESFPATKELNAALAYALLTPWTRSSCTEAHQRSVSALLVARNGDPRLAPQRWAALRSDVLAMFPDAKVDASFAVLRRWLIEGSMRAFFELVARTTANRHQWRERTEFWLAYLDTKMISEAWFALGARARLLAQRFPELELEASGKLTGGGEFAAKSTLLLTMGDLQIVEWSDNGKARFWDVGDPAAVAPNGKTYDGPRLRELARGNSLVELSHAVNWQPRFARFIYQKTGIRHPKHGAGL